jgi:hypothetical protein
MIFIRVAGLRFQRNLSRCLDFPAQQFRERITLRRGFVNTLRGNLCNIGDFGKAIFGFRDSQVSGTNLESTQKKLAGKRRARHLDKNSMPRP